MRAKFGLIFLVIASLLSMMQVIIFYSPSQLSGVNLMIVFLLTIGCVLGGYLTYSSRVKEEKKQKSGAIGFIVCIFLILAIALQILSSSGYTTSQEFFILMIYAIVFGMYGARGTLGKIIPTNFLSS